jgi:transposase
MKPLSSAQHFTVISLLQEGYSLCQIQSKTDVGKSTIGRIRREIDWDKENNTGGCPSKLSPCDKQSVIRQITTGKLDNAVQATNSINNIISSPVTPQTVRNALKESDFQAITKKKRPLLKKAY